MQSYIQFTYELCPDQVRAIYNQYRSVQRIYTTIDLTETIVSWPTIKHLYIKEALSALKISEDDLRQHELMFYVGAMFDQDFIFAVKKLERIHTPDSIYVRFHISYKDANKFNTFKNKMKLKGNNIEEFDNYRDFSSLLEIKLI